VLINGNLDGTAEGSMDLPWVAITGGQQLAAQAGCVGYVTLDLALGDETCPHGHPESNSGIACVSQPAN